MTGTIRALALCFLAIAEGVCAQETPRHEVVVEYIRQLAAVHDIQEQAKKELAKSQDVTYRLVEGIRGSTRIKLELNRGINAFTVMRLNKPFDLLLPNVISIYTRKINLHDTMIDMSTQILSGPQEGVNYGALVATAPQITAMLEALDKTQFSASTAFCLMLVDETRTDSNKILDHLRITKKQRDDLVRKIDTAFGAALSANEDSYPVQTAGLFKDFLTNKLDTKYKASDER